MTVDVDVVCGRCASSADRCLAGREDCCAGCTHLPVLPADDVDVVAVARAVDGDLSVPLTRLEHRQVWQLLEARGCSQEQIGAALGVTKRTVQRWCAGIAAPSSRHAAVRSAVRGPQ